MNEKPKLVWRDGGFEIWEMPDGKAHLVVPSMETVVCEKSGRETAVEKAKRLMYQIQGHVQVRGTIEIKEEGEYDEAITKGRNKNIKQKGDEQENA